MIVNVKSVQANIREKADILVGKEVLVIFVDYTKILI